MVTASHLPGDRNGVKFFSANNGGFQKTQIHRMLELAQEHVHVWFNIGTLPSASTNNVYCSEYVNWMVRYEEGLKNALLKQINHDLKEHEHGDVPSSLAAEELLPLKGLNTVLNSGNGSGGLFFKILEDLTENVDGSINIMPDSTFPRDVPNSENDKMVKRADLGIILDTDA
jgi:phosphomannomutase